MNMLVAGEPQVLNQGEWLKKLKTEVRHTGNAMSREEILQLSNEIDIHALEQYCLAVGRRTREIIILLHPDELNQKVDPARIQRIWDEGAAIKAAQYIVDYWSKRTKAGLLLMPPTRHWLVHLNEALKLKKASR
jgi:hypothetical protein